LGAQGQLTLAEAFRRADAAGYGNRIAAGEAAAQRAQATGALQGILPSVRLTSGYVRTDDPLAAFGYTLQQRGVSAASFDPARLNVPEPVSNWSGGVTAEVPLVNVDAWLGRGAADRAAAARDAVADWTRTVTRLDVTRAYFGAVLARERVGTLEAALRAAQAHVRQAESMVENGMATPSDALLAGVQRGQVEAQLIAALGAARLARQHLAVLLGESTGTSYLLPDSLPQGATLAALVRAPVPGTIDDRADVAAARLGRDATERDTRRATAAWLPRVNGFGRYDWNSPDAPFDGDGSYTVGVMASWSPFAGGSQLAARSEARARSDVAHAMAEAAEARAEVEIAAADIDREVATAQLDIAELGVTQATGAHRIVARKYAGGLATVAELLSAAATETQARLGRSAARYQAIAAAAALRQAAGADLMDLTVLEN
jgi:outer membrane protein TolC